MKKKENRPKRQNRPEYRKKRGFKKRLVRDRHGNPKIKIVDGKQKLCYVRKKFKTKEWEKIR